MAGELVMSLLSQYILIVFPECVPCYSLGKCASGPNVWAYPLRACVNEIKKQKVVVSHKDSFLVLDAFVFLIFKSIRMFAY